MSTNRTTRLRILVLRDPGFQMGDQETGLGDVTTVLETEPSFKVTEGPAGYGEAARAVQRTEVDLVLVDEVAGDPAAVVEQLDAAAPDIPVVVLLPSDQQALAQSCILAGARAYLFRPIELAAYLRWEGDPDRLQCPPGILGCFESITDTLNDHFGEIGTEAALFGGKLISAAI